MTVVWLKELVLLMSLWNIHTSNAQSDSLFITMFSSNKLKMISIIKKLSSLTELNIVNSLLTLQVLFTLPQLKTNVLLSTVQIFCDKNKQH